MKAFLGQLPTINAIYLNTVAKSIPHSLHSLHFVALKPGICGWCFKIKVNTYARNISQFYIFFIYLKLFFVQINFINPKFFLGPSLKIKLKTNLDFRLKGKKKQTVCQEKREGGSFCKLVSYIGEREK